MSMRHLILGLTVPAIVLLGTACTSHEGGEEQQPKTVEPEPKPEPDPKPEPEPEPEPAPVVATAAVSAVYLMDDCPRLDPKPPAAKKSLKPSSESMPAPPAEGARAEPKLMDEEMGDVPKGESWEPSCSQSTMQVAFSGQGDEPGKVKIDSVRLITPQGKELAKINARAPTLWGGNNYVAWDATIPANTDIKTSYRLSVPDWSAVSAKGVSPEGSVLVLEVTVDINGQKQTVRSPEFTREMPHDIVT